MTFSFRHLCFSVVASILLHPLPSIAQEEKLVPPKLPIGMNLSGVADYNPGFPFKNVMWGARPWMTKNEDGQGAFDTGMAERIPLDGDGCPLELPFTPEGASQPQYVFTIIPNTTEPGEYVVLYDGEGEVEGAMGTKAVSTEPGRVVIELKNSQGYEGIAIKRSTKGNHVRNIRILSLADEKADLKADPFRKDFLEYCKQWHALRFMDWMATNGSLEKEWSKRKPVTFYTMVGASGDAIGKWGKPASEFQCRFSGGVPLEIMIQLANMTKTSPWFCMPHRATPEYMTEFAKIVKATLDPSLKVYVEYSNEVWNWQFQQSAWMINSRLAGESLAGGGVTGWKNGVVPSEFPLDNGDVAKDGGADHPERMGVLDRHCFTQWENVFTDADRERIVRVIGVQQSWLDTVQRTVKWVMEHGGADAVASAGYVGPNDETYQKWEAAGADLTADQVIADLNEILTNTAGNWTRANAGVAKKYGLRYIVYEGGQHLQPKGQKETPYMPALKAAQTHPGMYDLYLKNLAVHQEVGCDLFCAFASVGKQGLRWGSWGHSESYGQPLSEAPKLRALVDCNLPK